MENCFALGDGWGRCSSVVTSSLARLAPQKQIIIITATISAKEDHAHLGRNHIFFSKQTQHDYFLWDREEVSEPGGRAAIAQELTPMCFHRHKLVPGAPPSSNFQSHSLSSNPNLNLGTGPRSGHLSNRSEHLLSDAWCHKIEQVRPRQQPFATHEILSTLPTMG